MFIFIWEFKKPKQKFFEKAEYDMVFVVGKSLKEVRSRPDTDPRCIKKNPKAVYEGPDNTDIEELMNSIIEVARSNSFRITDFKGFIPKP